LTTKWQIVALTSVAALGAVIYFADKVPAKDSAEHKHEEAAVVGKTDFLSEAKKLTSASESEAVAKLENMAAAARNQEQKIQLLDSLVKLWDDNRKPTASAIVSQQLAEASGKASDWYATADRYMMATRFVKEEAQKKQLYESAKSAFEKTLQLEPGNLDAKAGLGVSMVESAGLTGQPPMQGIGLLREVVAADSTHINAQLNLGYFAIQSAQFDKAIARFETVKRIKPDFIEVHLYIADTYEKMGNNKEAIKNLEVYKSKLSDPVLVVEVDKYINELKSK
jgi:predicted Zn-dependent protease